MSEQLRIYAFGGLSIAVGDTAVTGLASRKADGLLLYLAANPRPHTREALATLFWDDRTTQRALANLSVILTSLRKQLNDYLIITRQSIGINPQADIWLDMQSFVQLVAARAGSRDDEPVVRSDAARLEQAIDLYTGDLLEGFILRSAEGFEEWATLERERLRQFAYDALSQLVTYHQERRQLARAIDYASRLVALDPLSEAAHRHLMLLYARDGQRTTALEQYAVCARILDEELGVEPDAATTGLYQQLLSGAPSEATAGPDRAAVATALAVASLPAETSPFLGREAELRLLDERLDDPACRLITILGPGGVGKSRLALHAALRRAEDFTHGAAFVPLAEISAAQLLADAIGDHLHVSFVQGQDTAVQLRDFLRQKELLLILDNMEHVADGAPLLADLLRNAPRLQIITTSRERLHLREEWLLPLHGLPVPAENGAPEASAAVALFVQSSRRVRADFTLDGHETAVARICRLMDGLPLGIELAASWTRLLEPAEIVTEVERSLGFLETTLRDVPARHRSLAAVFTHSWVLISEAEQKALRRLSVFRGGFDRASATAVAGVSLLTLASLADKSFLRLGSPQRYAMHTLVRQFALEKLQEDPAAARAAHQAHCAYFLAFLAERREALLGGRQQAALAEIRAEIGNIRAALGWALEEGAAGVSDADALHASDALFQFFTMQSWFQEGALLFGAALKSPHVRRDSTLHGWVLARCGWLAHLNGRPADGAAQLQQALALLESAHDRSGSVFCRNYLGASAFYRGDTAVAQEVLQIALADARAGGDRPGEAIALNILGAVHEALEQYDQAELFLRESLTLKKGIGDRWGMSFSLGNLGNVAVAQGDLQAANRLYQQSLELRRELGDRRGEALCLTDLADLAARQGNATAARERLIRAAAIWVDLGNVHTASALQARADLLAE